jgi:hypothetical protein
MVDKYLPLSASPALQFVISLSLLPEYCPIILKRGLVIAVYYPYHTRENPWHSKNTRGRIILVAWRRLLALPESDEQIYDGGLRDNDTATIKTLTVLSA